MSPSAFTSFSVSFPFVSRVFWKASVSVSDVKSAFSGIAAVREEVKKSIVVSLEDVPEADQPSHYESDQSDQAVALAEQKVK